MCALDLTAPTLPCWMGHCHPSSLTTALHLTPGPAHHRQHCPLCFPSPTDWKVFLKGVSHCFLSVDYVKLGIKGS